MPHHELHPPLVVIPIMMAQRHRPETKLALGALERRLFVELPNLLKRSGIMHTAMHDVHFHEAARRELPLTLQDKQSTGCKLVCKFIRTTIR